MLMSSNKEVEIKFRISNLRDLKERMQRAHFRLHTPRTHEMNTLYDLPGNPLRRRGDLLRLREYGCEWVLTHKAKGRDGRHKTRAETETKVAEGKQMEGILQALGYLPTFRYEKFRAEWEGGRAMWSWMKRPSEILGKSKAQVVGLIRPRAGSASREAITSLIPTLVS